MTSKTFKTAHADNKVLKVDKLFGNPRLLIKEFDGDARGFAFAPSDAPALALAILEAAGYSEEYEGGNCWAGPLGQAMHMLRLETEAHERATAEARELAELEAEALELRNAFTLAIGGRSIDSFAEHSVNKPGWIDAARRARELAKEATK